MRFKPDRALYIPKGAMKFTDRQSSAVAYASEDENWYRLIGFHGRAQKPDFNFRYPKNEQGKANREKRGLAHFKCWRAVEAHQAERRAVRKAFVHDFKVGDVFGTCWGYDQTNREYYECVEVLGKSLMVRRIRQSREYTQSMAGKCVPLVGDYIGEPFKVLAKSGGFKADYGQFASFQAPKIIAGVKAYDSDYFSQYA